MNKLFKMFALIFVCLSVQSCGKESDEAIGNETTDSENVSEEVETEVVFVEYDSQRNRHSFLVTGKYQFADLYPDKLVKVGFCTDTHPHPKVTDISVPECAINPENNTVYAIPNRMEQSLEEGTPYYIRAYRVEGNKITYYKETAVETLGSSVSLHCWVQDDYESGHYEYDIKQKGTYRVYVFFRGVSIQGGDIELGFVNEGKGSGFFRIGSWMYSMAECCYVRFVHMETGVTYQYKMRLGWTSGK